jgi:hypothetical protein
MFVSSRISRQGLETFRLVLITKNVRKRLFLAPLAHLHLSLPRYAAYPTQCRSVKTCVLTLSDRGYSSRKLRFENRLPGLHCSYRRPWPGVSFVILDPFSFTIYSITCTLHTNTLQARPTRSESSIIIVTYPVPEPESPPLHFPILHVGGYTSLGMFPRLIGVVTDGERANT